MNFLLHIIQTIIIISFIIVIAWGIEKIVKTRVGYLWRKWLWLLLAVRLILPFPISISQFTGSVPEVNITVPMTEQGRVFVGNTFSEQNPAPTVPNDHTEAVTTPVTPKKEIAPLGIAILLWINGAVIALCLRYFQYRKLRNRCLADSFVCESEEVKSAYTQLCKELRIDRTLPVRAWKDGQSPMLLGYFKTTLLLPDAFFYSDSELDAVLRHELTHLKSGDLWYKLLMVIVCDIYWFNPIFRLTKSMAFRDVEYVCDEKQPSDGK